MTSEHQSMTSKVTRGKWRQILLVLAILEASFSFVAVSHSSPAHAASNGQQIEFACPPDINWVNITGKNQNGSTVTWSSGNVATSVVYTSGWWWIGTVTTQYNVWVAGKGNVTYTQHDSVPQWWPTSVYTIDCRLTNT